MGIDEYLKKVETIYNKQGLNYKFLYKKCTDQDLRLICKTIINFDFPEEFLQFESLARIKDITAIITDQSGEITAITWNQPIEFKNKMYASMFYLSIKQTSYVNMIVSGWISYVNLAREMFIMNNNEYSFDGQILQFANKKYNKFTTKLVTPFYSEDSWISKKMSISQSELDEVFSEKNGFRNPIQIFETIGDIHSILLQYKT